jgi:hypothetical protein
VGLEKLFMLHPLHFGILLGSPADAHYVLSQRLEIIATRPPCATARKL